MTNEELKEIEERAKASTPTEHMDNEPFYSGIDFRAAGKPHGECVHGCDPFCPHGEAARKDQEFFNHAREDVLALVEEVRNVSKLFTGD